MEHESIICIEFIIALDKALKLMEEVGVNRKVDDALVSNSGRVELFSAFLAEELEVDRLAVYLHTRDYTQQLLGVRFRELYVSLQVDYTPPSLKDQPVTPKKKRNKKRKKDEIRPVGTTTLLADNLFLDPVEFDGDMEELDRVTREGEEVVPGKGKVIPPSVKIPFFLKLTKDACMPDAPLLSLDMRTLKVLCQSLTPDCSEEIRSYMVKRCLYWTDVLCRFKGSMFKVWQQLKNVTSFYKCKCKGLNVDGLKVVPAQVFLWMMCTEMGSYADVTEQIVATSTGVSDETTTEQSVAMLNNVYDQDRAREKAMDEEIHLEEMELSQCNAHILKLEKKRRQVERKWKEYSPDLTLKGLQAKQAEANKGFSVSDITDLTAEITEFEGLRSSLEAKIKRLKKNKKNYLDDVEDMWEVALKGKRKFQGLKPIKTRKQVKSIKGTTNTKWRDVVIEKIIHAMKRNVQMTEVERAAQESMADTISNATSKMSDESVSMVESSSIVDFDAMLQQFGESLANDSSTINPPEDDTASLIRGLEKEAQELAAVGQQDTDEGHGMGSILSSLDGTAEIVVDMDNYDTQHIKILGREEGTLEEDNSTCSDLKMFAVDREELDSQRLSLVSREAESFVENILFHRPFDPGIHEEKVISEDTLDMSELDFLPEPRVNDINVSEVIDQLEEQRRELVSREAGEFVGGLLSSSMLSSIKTREELGEYNVFEFVSDEKQERVEFMFAQQLRGWLQTWQYFSNLRRSGKKQLEEMRQQHARNVLNYLNMVRKEAMDRKVAKIVNAQNLKYYIFIKHQTKLKLALTSLQNTIVLKNNLIGRNNSSLEKMKNVLHFKMRKAMVEILERVYSHSAERASFKRARKFYNSKLFKKREECLMEWLVWTKKILYLKYNATIRIQLLVRRFIARKYVQKVRQAAKIRENALLECTEIGRQKLLMKALRRLQMWQKKYSSLRCRREKVTAAACRPLLKAWRDVHAARKISRTVRAYFGRDRARARRIRLTRGAELADGLPVIFDVRTQQRAIDHWKILCGSKIFIRNFTRFAMLTKVARRFAHWKNMNLERNDFLSQQASIIISMARMKLTKNRICNFPVVRRGVLKFQSVVRGRFAQQVVAVLRAREYAGVTIQKNFRGYLCRKGLRQKRIVDIHFSAANNKYERLKYYCENYFNLTFQADDEGNFAMHNAAKNASKRCLKLLIKFHHDPTLTNSDGYTPLHLLIMSSAIHRDAVFEYMLEIGFDEEQFTADGKSALVLACEYGRSRIVNLCLEHGLNPNQPDYHNTSCLQYAILGNFAPIVRTLLQYEADSNQVGFEGMSPLHDVAATGNLEIVTILIEESKMETDIDINVQDQTYGYTPVMVAARNGFDEIVLKLCTLMCSVEIVDWNNWSAAHHCCLANNPDTVNHLREMVADFDAVDYLGNTPMHVAAENGNHLALRELLSLGAIPSWQNTQGNQPAHLAAMNNHVDCLNLLVRYDEHIGRVNYEHRTPLGMAKFHVAEEARVFLEEWFTKVAGPETRNAVGDIWWDAELDNEVGEWITKTDEANHRIFINTVTGETTLDPPRLAYQHVASVAENAEAPMRMKVIQNEGENKTNQHVYLAEHAVVKGDIEKEILQYDAATVINKTARRKFAYKLYRIKVIEARRRRILTNFFLRAFRVLAIRRMLRNTRMWRRVQACWRGYIFRCHFYYWDGTYDVMWYARARRRLAKNVWTLYKDYKFRQMRMTLKVAASAPTMLDEWSDILDSLGHPLRVIGVIEEYLYPGTTNINFYRNVNTGNIVFQKPKEIEEKDLRDHRDRIMLTEKGFTKNQEILAKKLQSMWRGYKVRTRFRIIIRAKNISLTAQQKFLDYPDNDQHLFNYTLYVQVVLNDYDRARPLYIEMLRKMTHRGPDIAQILYAYAIFSLVVHDQEFEECMSFVERGKVAEEKQYNYLRRQKLKGVDMKGYENYKNIPVSQGSTFELAQIGFFHYTTTYKQVSEVYHNYAASTFLIYRDFDKAFDAYLKAFQLDPFNHKCRMNYDSMMKFVCGDDPNKVDKVAKARMQLLHDKDHKRNMQAEAVRIEAHRRQQCAVRIQRWYSHHKGLRNYYKFVEKLRRKKRRAGLIK